MKKVNKIKKIKLSEAILKGCKGTRKHRGGFFGSGDDPRECCALGAALYALGGKHVSGMGDNCERSIYLRKSLPVLDQPMENAKALFALASNACFMSGNFSIFYLIVKLNDNTNISRQAIARALAKDGF